MPLTGIVGIVYYADDPDKKPFRIIYPEFDDSELDGPPTDHRRMPYRKEDGSLHSWTTLGIHPSRQAVMQKVHKSKLDGLPKGVV